MIWAERFSIKDNCPLPLLPANAETVHLIGKSLWASARIRSGLDSCGHGNTQKSLLRSVPGTEVL